MAEILFQPQEVMMVPRVAFVPSGLLRREHLLVDEPLDSAADLFTRLGELLQAPRGPRAGLIAQRLARRHQRASTALARGIALPHAAVSGLRRPVVAFVRSRRALDFGAADGHPCRDFLTLLVPNPGTAAHLELLAQLRLRLLAHDFAIRLALDQRAEDLWARLGELLPP